MQRVEMSSENIKRYKDKSNGLNRVKFKDGKDNGYIYIENGMVVGFIVVSDKYIQDIEVTKLFRLEGLGRKMVTDAYNYGAIFVKIEKKNEDLINFFLHVNYEFTIEDKKYKFMKKISRNIN